MSVDNNRETDLILKPGEYCFLLDKTKGVVSTLTGFCKLSMSATDSTVDYREDLKKFVEVPTKDAIKNFVVIPEGWYCTLLNPAERNEHPKIGTSNVTPELRVGEKIVDCGPKSYALYPGQMAKVIKGHSLHSNEYILAEVYNADAEEIKDKKYYNGQHIVIKGEQSYIPPTGIKVIPKEDGSYIRKGAMLESNQYAILLNESGEKEYVRGPAIVFPEASQHFIINEETGTEAFQCIELSDISGIYIKVIEDYTENPIVVDYITEEDKDGNITKIPKYSDPIVHKAGEELFITGKDTKIYYPRKEHSIISYNGKIIHHAIAIPDGEGRYVLNRETGQIRTIKAGMHLLDPRYEVLVDRKLTKKECELWYPGNKEVLEYNCPSREETSGYITADSWKNLCNAITTTTCDFTASATVDSLSNGFLGQDNVVTYSKAGFDRGNTFTKPRSIEFNNKYDGAVTIDVWTGYAVNVVDKSGKNHIEIGPRHVILDYGESLEEISGDVYLRIENDDIYDCIVVQTKDFVNVNIELYYYINFNPAQKNNWFSIGEYEKRLTDTEESLIKREAKKYTVEEFYNNATDIIRSVVLSTATETKKSAEFSNGMYIYDVAINTVEILDKSIKEMIDQHQNNIVAKMLELSAANKDIAVATEIAKLNKEKADLQYQGKMHELELNNKLRLEDQKKKDEYARLVEASHKAEREAEKELQTLKAAISKIELAAAKEKTTQEFSFRKESDKMYAEREKNHTDAIKKVLDSISPQLVAAIESGTKSEMLRDVSQSIAPYAIASGNESVADVVNKLTKGTSLEGIIDKIVDTNKE